MVRGINLAQLYSYLKKSSAENIIDTFLLVFNARDCRGGKGERDIGRLSFQWLFINYPDMFMKIYHLIPEYGRWDDLLYFFPGTLKLDNINYIRDNYISNVKDSKDLDKLREYQNDIVAFYANQLVKDRELMLIGKPISLCAKWAPSEKCALNFDNNGLLVKALCKQLSINPTSYRKLYLSPLRAYLNIVERLICSNKWDCIDFSSVPSCAMRRLKNAFDNHVPDEFSNWKNKLASKETNVKSKQLFPHELVRDVLNDNYDTVSEEQWKGIIDEAKKLGILQDILVVVDTSFSMTCNNSLPLHVAISMGLLIATITEGTFHNHIMTFNTTPKFAVIKDGNLHDQVHQIKNIEWGGSTNLQKTFELILSRSTQYKLSNEDLPKKIIIISDMQFNECEGSHKNKTNFQVIEKQYKDHGYTRPQIVFWNVNGDSHDFPVTSDENGSMMISGFSPSIMKCLMQSDTLSSSTILRKIIDDDRYDPVKMALN
jgi:hypothetical protein